MTIFIFKANENIVSFRIASLNEGTLLEATIDVLPGEDFAGNSFDELLKLGLGEHQIKER